MKIGGTFGDLIKTARDGIAKGIKPEFAPGSFIITGGGMKGLKDAPADWEAYVKDYFGIDKVGMVYGMSEGCGSAPRCSEKYFHIMPHTMPLLFDRDMKLLPREGEQTGRYAFFDVQAETYWGGFISGDQVTINWEEDCACGWKGPRIGPVITRFAEMEGGDDKITCAGTAAGVQRVHGICLTGVIMTDVYRIPIISRGRIIEPGEDAVSYKGRGGATFLVPDPHKHIHDLVLGNPVLLSDLQNTPIGDIIDFLAEAGKRLQVEDNPYLQESFELALQAGGLGRADPARHLRRFPAHVRRPTSCSRRSTTPSAPTTSTAGSPRRPVRHCRVRAVGTRQLHITAGNVPVVAALTIIRGALTKSDILIKSPSNDPLTANAIARTLIELDASHPVVQAHRGRLLEGRRRVHGLADRPHQPDRQDHRLGRDELGQAHPEVPDARESTSPRSIRSSRCR